MARKRDIKPAFFLNEHLAECSAHARLLAIGLMTLADREGRIEFRPKKIQAQLFPYEKVDVSKLVAELVSANYLIAYEAAGIEVIAICNFAKHQNIHPKEQESDLPAIPENEKQLLAAADREKQTLVKEGKEGKDRSKKNGRAEKFKEPDRSGNPRSPLPKLPQLWLSVAELRALESKFKARGLRPEFWPEAFLAVDRWFTQNPRKHATSAAHADRIADWGLDEALNKQATYDRAQGAQARNNQQSNEGLSKAKASSLLAAVGVTEATEANA